MYTLFFLFQVDYTICNFFFIIFFFVIFRPLLKTQVILTWSVLTLNDELDERDEKSSVVRLMFLWAMAALSG